MPPEPLINRVRAASESEWDAIFDSCGYSTFFHSRQWAEAWACYTRGYLEPEARLVEFSDDKKALLSWSSAVKSFRMSVNPLKPVRYGVKYVSSPGWTYGGWISDDELTQAHEKALWEYISRNYPDLDMRHNPFSPFSVPDGWTHDETDALALENSGISRAKFNNQVRKAVKEGVLVKVAQTLEEWRDYYSVYRESLQRWGDNASSRYGWRLFEELSRLPGKYAALWLARKDEKVIAGALVFYAKKHAVYWHGAALGEYFTLRPVNLLMSEAVRDACGRGMNWFDLNPSGGHEGVRAFKRSLGAMPLKCPYIVKAAG